MSADYRAKGVQRGDALYLDLTTAVEFVKDCDRDDIAVLGIEGFVLRGDNLEARPDLVCDFSPAYDADQEWPEYREQANRAALRFITGVAHDEGLVFHFDVFTLSQWTGEGYGP
jgi:hypothetical protein